MGDQPRDDRIEAHIAALSLRTPGEAKRLADRLAGHSWPGGGVDRCEPGALEWVRRWRPLGFVTDRVVCACSSGRCPVCN